MIAVHDNLAICGFEPIRVTSARHPRSEVPSKSEIQSVDSGGKGTNGSLRGQELQCIASRESGHGILSCEDYAAAGAG